MRFQRIEALLKESFQPKKLEIVDESDQHAGRAGQESHFKILVVSEGFSGLNRVQRQRKVYDLLKEELEQGLHALSLRLLTEEEFAQQVSDFQTPDCQGSH